MVTSDGTTVPPCTVGAIKELIVAAELLRDGWSVYRSLSVSAACDLVAIKGKRILRIEVRSATRNGLGHLQYGGQTRVELRADRYTTLALVVDGEAVIYSGEKP